ncbi:hypothetical protein LCGC14_2478550, partial [marine sediment metagenome]
MPRTRSRRSNKNKVNATHVEPVIVPVNLSKELSSDIDGILDQTFGRTLENPDLTIEEHAWRHSLDGIELYNEMLRKDVQLRHVFDIRALTCIAQGWQIEPAGEEDADIELAEWVEQRFLRIRHFAMSRQLMFQGISHGYKPAELMFHVDPTGNWTVDEFRNRDPARFRFNADSQLVMTQQGDINKDETMPEEKFITNTWGSDENRYGSGLLRVIYPLWFFKNFALKSFYKFIE